MTTTTADDTRFTTIATAAPTRNRTAVPAANPAATGLLPENPSSANMLMAPPKISTVATNTTAIAISGGTTITGYRPSTRAPTEKSPTMSEPASAPTDVC